MKKSWLIATVLLCAIVGFLAFVLEMASDVVTSRYATLSAARADNLFERGWLPDILPPSAKSIRTSNNLDLNTSEGEFSFAPADYSLFAYWVRPYETVDTPFARFEKDMARMQSRGFQPTFYVDATNTWVFFCKQEAGYCEYTMWTRKG